MPAKPLPLFQVFEILLLCLLVGVSTALPAAYNDTDGSVILLGQKLKTNNQYCFYQLIQGDHQSDYRLITPSSLARSDIIAAAQAESVNMSKALNFYAYAVFPAGVACGGTALTWLGIGKKFGYATLLSCSVLAILVVGARNALAEEESNLQQTLDELLAGKQSSSEEERHADLFRVLQWLKSDESSACPLQPTNQ